MSWEVKTMPSGTLSSERPALGRTWRKFYPTLYAKNLRRFWPIWSIYFVILLFLLPLSMLSSARYRDMSEVWVERYVLNTLSVGIVLNAFFGLFCAMAVFSYLYNAKSAGMLHALPVRREGLFLTNWLSGFTFLAVPNAAIFLITLLAEAAIGQVAPWGLVLWLLSMTLVGLFFYSFAVFCAMFTGNLVALPVFYGILNFLVKGLSVLFEALAEAFLFGYYSSDWVGTLANWFTPVVKLCTQVGPNYDDWNRGAGPLRGFSYILLYAVVGVVFSLLALAVYRRRRLESAGDIVAVSWVRPIFKYGVAFCAAIFLGVYGHAFLFSSLPDNLASLVLFLVLFGLVGYFAAEMLLHKSFRVFRRSWKGAAVFTLALVLCCAGLQFDLLGFERWVPDPDDIQSVSLRNISTAPYDSGDHGSLTLTDPEDIAAAVALHAAIVDHRAELDGMSSSFSYQYEWDEETQMDCETAGLTYFRLAYTTRSGREITRQYEISVTADLLAQSDSPAARLDSLLNDPSVVEKLYFADLPDSAVLFQAGVNNDYEVSDGSLYTSYQTRTLTEEESALLLQAVRNDIAAGRLGRRFLLEDRERYQLCYYNDLTLSFYFPNTTDGPNTQPADVPSGSTLFEVTITLQTTATETIAALEELGLVDGAHPLLTHQEMMAAEQGLTPSALLLPDTRVAELTPAEAAG